MLESIPQIGELETAFEQFTRDPQHRFIVHVRQKRAAQLRELLSGSASLDAATFDHEVWHLESQTYWHERNITLQLFDKDNGQSRLEQVLQEYQIPLETLEQALEEGTLELHGNYIWGQGSYRYAPGQRDEDIKNAQIQQAIDILNNRDLTPEEKGHHIDNIPGFGENNATGLVMVFHPTAFALVNKITEEVLKKLGFAADTSSNQFQEALLALKERLGAQDFIELDWFLYQYSNKVQERNEIVTAQDKKRWLDYVIRVLQDAGEPLNYTEITKRVLALGPQTQAKTPANTVSRTLTTNPHLFERINRGTYRLKSSLKEMTEEDDVVTAIHVKASEYPEPPFDEILTSLTAQGMYIDERTARSYHLSLKTGRMVILAGPSGTGKTWLAEAYAHAAGAADLLVPVASNWTTNEDLLGYADPFHQEVYHDTTFSSFLRLAAQDYEQAIELKYTPRPYHVILDEMNLARVEYYFAKFLSAMEVRARKGVAYIELGPQLTVSLYPNVHFIGTINVDETTHGFADKVYDRSELVVLSVSPGRIREYIGHVPYQDILMQVWSSMYEVAPFAYRVIEEIKHYIEEAEKLDVPWQEALDDQILQKVLPKCRGYSTKLGEALEQLRQIIAADTFPNSSARITKMVEGYYLHGIVSYF